MLFAAHYHDLTALGGIPKRGSYDNMKTVIDRVGHGKARTMNKRFQAVVSHCLYETALCNPAAGWAKKGLAEKNIQGAWHRLGQKDPTFRSLDDLKAWLSAPCQQLWPENLQPEDKQRSVVYRKSRYT